MWFRFPAPLMVGPIGWSAGAVSLGEEIRADEKNRSDHQAIQA
jgi:peptidase E